MGFLLEGLGPMKLNVSGLNDFVCLSKHLHRLGKVWGIRWRMDSGPMELNGSGLNDFVCLSKHLHRLGRVLGFH